MSSDDNTFEENIFQNNIAGAAVMYSRRITLRRNQFLHNRGFSSFGILFQDCEHCTTEENLIFNNATGIFIEGARESIFRKNTIIQNDVALQIFSSSLQNLFSENNFIDNLSPLIIVGKSANTSWQSGVGNYWSDYSGYDLDGDGFGDIPHKIQNVFEYLEGNFPRTRIYLNSPAAQAIVVAEKSFPVLQSSNEFDRRPLMRPFPSDLATVEPAGAGSAKWLLALFSTVLLLASGFLLTRKFNK
jgi:nitrous oxidase accessory protein